MRKLNQQKLNRQAHLGCRVDKKLHASVEAAARRRGIATSELLRMAIEAELAKGPAADVSALDPAVIARAASGSLDAQRAITQHGLRWALDPRFPRDQVFAVAEFCGRMAASHGDPDDIIILAGLLMKRAEWLATCQQEEEILMAQAIELMNRAADAGHGPAVEHLATARLLGVSDAIFEQAAEMREIGLSEVAFVEGGK